MTAATKSPDSGTATLREAVDLVLRGWWLIALCFLAAVGLAIAYILVATPLYRAQVSLYIEPVPNPGVTADRGVGADANLISNLIQSHVKLITSGAVLQRVVDRERLGSDPEFNTGASGTPEENNARVLLALSRAVQARNAERTFLVDIEVTSRSATKAARIADAVAQAFLDELADSRVRAARSESQWAQRQLVDLQARLRAADAKVQDFKAKNGIFGPDGKLVSDDQLANASKDVLAARARAADAGARLAEIQRIIASGRVPDSSADALKSATIDKLRGQYAEIARQAANLTTTLGPQHPAMQEVQRQLADTKKLIDTELLRLADGARVEMKTQKANEVAAEKQAQAQRRDSEASLRAQVDLKSLEREADTARAAYDRVAKSATEVPADAAETTAARIVSPAAVPLRPASPNKAAVLILAAAAGLSLGIGAVLLRGARVAQVEKEAPREPARPPLPRSVAPIPRVLRKLPAASPRTRLGSWLGRRRADALQSARDAMSPYARTADALRGDIARVADEDRMTTVLVQSAEAERDAAALALHLAASFARDGKRTLLVDAEPEDSSLTALKGDAAARGMMHAWGTHFDVFDLAATAGNNVYLMPLSSRPATSRERRVAAMRFTGIGGNFDAVVVHGGRDAKDALDPDVTVAVTPQAKGGAAAEVVVPALAA